MRRLSLVLSIKFTFFNKHRQRADTATNTQTAASPVRCVQLFGTLYESNQIKVKRIFLIVIIIAPLSICGQIKLFYDTSKLIIGSGIATLQSSTGENFGFITYKNGRLNGKFHQIDTAREYSLKGELRYSPSCVNYSPGVKIKYANASDTFTMVIDSALFIELFKFSKEKIIETQFALAPENISGIHPDLNIGLSDDPAVVPIGKWQRLDLKQNYVLTQFDFDHCGNLLLITHFKPDGSILSRHKYKPKDKKKRYWL